MTEREEQIIHIVLFTNRTEAYFKDMTDDEVEREYKRLIELD